jgi:hypothetical protein
VRRGSIQAPQPGTDDVDGRNKSGHDGENFKQHRASAKVPLLGGAAAGVAARHARAMARMELSERWRPRVALPTVL